MGQRQPEAKREKEQTSSPPKGEKEMHPADWCKYDFEIVKPEQLEEKNMRTPWYAGGRGEKIQSRFGEARAAKRWGRSVVPTLGSQKKGGGYAHRKKKRGLELAVKRRMDIAMSVSRGKRQEQIAYAQRGT